MKEHQQIEWKLSWRDEYLRWICGFANAQGGILVIGKNDSGKLVGLPNARKLLEDIPNKVRDILGIVVDVNLHNIGSLEWLEIMVEPYPSPISYKGEYHVRSGSTKQELKGAALSAFLLKKQGLHWDGVAGPRFGMANCSAAAVALFKAKASKSGRMDDAVLQDSTENLLRNLQLFDGDYLKRAAALLFSDTPENTVNGATIKIGFFVNDHDLRYQDEINGSLLAQVEKAMELLYSKYLKAFISYEGLQRVETFLFPRAAIREALLNAVVHKDYSSGIPIQISVYDDKVVIWGSGALPPDWTLERLLSKHPSAPPNPLIAHAFFRAGYIESWGRGIEKINDECRAHGISVPAYDAGMSGLMVTFRANAAKMAQKLKLGVPKTAVKAEKPSVKPSEKTSVKPSEKTSEKIMVLIKRNDAITAAEIAAALNKTPRSIELQFAKLKADGRLERVGPANGGYWKITGADNAKTNE